MRQAAPAFRSFNATAAARAGAGQPVGTAGPETREVRVGHGDAAAAAAPESV